MDFYNNALEIGKFLSDAKAEDVVVMDLREANIWTDFFVVATVMSATHASGLEAQLEEEIKKMGMNEYYRKRSSEQGSEWKLVDIGGIVVHLMSKMARSFYDLEGLHKDAKKIEI